MSDDYPTPEWLKKCFEGWDDPAPMNGATNGADGLLRDWGDRTFVNIPYSTPGPWIDKAIAESRRGKTVTLLVRVDTSTKWWARLVQARARIACFQGRITFYGQDSPWFASALVFL